MRRSDPPVPPSAASSASPSLPGRRTGAEVWLARHAEVDETWQGRAYGDLDVPLSAAGRERTLELAADLARARPALVLSSPLARALELGRRTSEASGAELLERDALREVHRGSWQGRAVAELEERAGAEVAAFYADPWSWRGHGGESDAQILARAAPALDEGLARVAGGRLLVTTHYNVARVLVAAALGIPPEHSFALRLDPGRLVVLRDDPQGWLLLHSNLSRPPTLAFVGDGAGEEASG